MDFGVMLILLLIAIDGVIGIHVLCMPLVSCALMGLVTGNLESAIAAGASAQVIYMLLRDEGFEAGLFSAFVVFSKEDSSSTMAMSMVAVLLAVALEHVIRLVMTLFVPAARNSAAKGDEKKIGLFNIAGFVVRVAIVLAASLVFVNGSNNLLSALETNYLWVLNGIAGASVMVKVLGIVIILRNLSAKDMPGAFLAGVAVAMLFVSSGAEYALFACALLAFSIGAYDFHNRTEKKETGSGVKGGAEKWW